VRIAAGSTSFERITGEGRKADPEIRLVSPRRERRTVDLPDPTGGGEERKGKLRFQGEKETGKTHRDPE
jgi:hypothetical protein